MRIRVLWVIGASYFVQGTSNLTEIPILSKDRRGSDLTYVFTKQLPASIANILPWLSMHSKDGMCFEAPEPFKRGSVL